jgi:FeS assembly SUF system regulator
MLRIGKLTDYATGLMAQLAHSPQRNVSAQQLALELGLPGPTVGAVLKRLCRAGLVRSVRGAAGGYGLVRAPETISVAAIITAIEGPVALTECALGEGNCSLEAACATRANWRQISRAVQVALETLSLADLAAPAGTTARTVNFRALPKQANGGDIHG